MSGLEDKALITVSKLEEHEDGSATLQVDTNTEATRFLVSIGLTTLLEKAIDAENDEYTLESP